MYIYQLSLLEQRSVIKISVIKEVNRVNFTEECVMCMENHVLVKICLQIG